MFPYFLFLFIFIGCAEPATESKAAPPTEVKAPDPYAHIQDEKARELIKASIERSGGLERWNTMKRLNYTKQFSLLREDGSVEKSYDQVHEYQFSPLKIKISSIENGDTLITIQEGNVFSRTKNGELMDVQPAALQKAINTSLYVIGIPFKLLDAGAKIRYVGPGALPDGRKTEIVEARYNSDVNANHSTSDIWRYHFDQERPEIIANWVDAGDHFALILNNSFKRENGILFHGNRESYRVDENGKPLFLRARYEYGDYKVQGSGY